MNVYFINLILILALAWPLCIYKPAKWKTILYLCITFGWMWFISTFRFEIGYDYNTYLLRFAAVQDIHSLDGLLHSFFEPGFMALMKLISLVSMDPLVFYGVIATIVLLPMMWFIYRHCQNVWFSTWIFVTLTFFYCSLNFVRQSIACSIIVLGYDWLRRKKAVPFLLLVLVAACFHKTALIMIPVYFLCHIRINKKLAIFYGTATVLIFMLSNQILDIVTTYVFTSYRNSFYLTTGLQLAYLVVPCALFIFLVCLYKGWQQSDPDASMLFNLMLFSCIIWLFITKHFILERFSMYLYIFSLVAIPSMLASLKPSAEMLEKRDRLQSTVKANKSGLHELKQLAYDIRQKEIMYWGALGFFLLLTFLYDQLGTNLNFHGVYPYDSVLSWLAP